MSTNLIPTSELNMRCAGVKRLLKEAAELSAPNELLYAKPMEDNLFEWHFTIRGPSDTVYENGAYHGRIILPVEYPMKPPSLILLTPNGRFETNKKVCLSISGYHPETWLPSWSIRTALLALIGFMPTHSKGALGGLECDDTERRRLAAKSLDWRCDACNCAMREILPLMEAAAAGQCTLSLNKNAKTTALFPSITPKTAKSSDTQLSANNLQNAVSTSVTTEGRNGSARGVRIFSTIWETIVSSRSSRRDVPTTGENVANNAPRNENSTDASSNQAASPSAFANDSSARLNDNNGGNSSSTTTPPQTHESGTMAHGGARTTLCVESGDRGTWFTMLMIFLLSAVFLALLIRRLSNA